MYFICTCIDIHTGDIKFCLYVFYSLFFLSVKFLEFDENKSGDIGKLNQ